RDHRVLGGASPLGCAPADRGRGRRARERRALRRRRPRPRESEGEGSMNATASARRHDIDWLRVGATYLLFAFHVAKVFDPAPFYHVLNGDLSFGMTVLCGFIHLWHMPLFFLLAGWSIVGSLGARGAGGFVRERMLRLFVPLVAGTALFGTVIKYFELRSGMDANFTGLYVRPDLLDGFRTVIPQGLPEMKPFHESFLAFWPTFFTTPERVTWAHLWFIAYLFTFSLLYLPIFVALLRRRPSGTRVAAPWVYAPIVPLALVQVFLRPYWPGLQNLFDDWANFAMYSTYVVAGFALAWNPALEDAAHREEKRAFAIAGAALVVLVLALFGVVRSPTVLLAGTAVAGWCLVVGMLGFARRALSFATRGLDYLVESALPVYILHQAGIVVPGYFIVQLPLGIAAKFFLLLAVAVASTMAVYHFVVRPFGPTRFLFGMRPRARRAAAWRAAPRAAAAVAIAVVATGAGARAADAGSPVGVWLAEGGAATVEIFPCDASLCGRVAWLRSPIDDEGCELRDERNPDPALRAR